MAASILDRYGIKEVCDFTFYKIEKDEKVTLSLVPQYYILIH